MNNPLQGVLGHLELLMWHRHCRCGGGDAAATAQGAEAIYQEADRAAKIVRNLLVFTGSQRMTRRRLRVDRVLTRALASRRARLARAGIEIVRDQPDEAADASSAIRCSCSRRS